MFDTSKYHRIVNPFLIKINAYTLFIIIDLMNYIALINLFVGIYTLRSTYNFYSSYMA